MPCPTPCYKSVVRKNAQNTNKLRLIAFAAPFATFAAMLFAQTPPARIVQLSPAAIPGLPANLVKELERRGCTIPQEAPTKKSSNVIKGAFAKPGQTDWAALCSVNGVSTILVFWKGSEKNPAALAPWKDSNYLDAAMRTPSPGSGADSGVISATMRPWDIAKPNGIRSSLDVGSKTKSFFSAFAGTFASSSVTEIWFRF